MRKLKKGFTIVELVIVIGVIGILSAILIPTFINLTDKANQAALQSNLANAYTEYYAAALDDAGIADQDRTHVYLSTTNAASLAANAKAYKCDAEGKWAEVTVASASASVYTTPAQAKAFNTYYVYIAA